MKASLYYWLWAPLVLLGTGCGNNKAGSGSAPPPVQVVVMEAKGRSVSETLSLVGTLAANEMVEIKAETDGVIEEILFQEGQTVNKGDLLIRLEEKKLAAALAEAEANYQLSSANFERGKQLFQDKLISQQEYDQTASSLALNEANLELRKQQLKDTRIYAPFEGVVGARSVSPGQVISKNSTLTWLVDLDPMKMEVNIPERFLGQLALSQSLEFPVDAFPGRKFKGEVYFIAPFVDPSTHTALVKAYIENPKHDLKPGMFATLELTLKVRENSLVIPEMALNQIQEDDRANIMVVKPDLTVELRPITVGIRLPGEIEVLRGLKPGEKVIIEGLQKVAPGSKVTIAPDEETEPYREPNENLTQKNVETTSRTREGGR